MCAAWKGKRLRALPPASTAQGDPCHAPPTTLPASASRLLPLTIFMLGSLDGNTAVVAGLYRSNEGGAWEQGWEGEARCNADRERWGAHHITAGRGVTVPA
jgi:hypothetical protein